LQVVDEKTFAPLPLSVGVPPQRTSGGAGKRQNHAPFKKMFSRGFFVGSGSPGARTNRERWRCFGWWVYLCMYPCVVEANTASGLFIGWCFRVVAKNWRREGETVFSETQSARNVCPLRRKFSSGGRYMTGYTRRVRETFETSRPGGLQQKRGRKERKLCLNG